MEGPGPQRGIDAVCHLSPSSLSALLPTAPPNTPRTLLLRLRGCQPLRVPPGELGIKSFLPPAPQERREVSSVVIHFC